MAFSVGLRVELSSLSTETHLPGQSLDHLIELASSSEAVGAESFFVRPLEDAGDPRVKLDPYVVLGACAARTSRITLGCLAAREGERPPALLAKVVTGLDVCSNARAMLVIAPSRRNRAESGRPQAQRTDQFVESLEILRAMVRIPSPSFRGAHYEIRSAWNEPKAVRLDEAIPLGVLLPADDIEATDASDQNAIGLAASLAIGARLAEYCFVEVGVVGTDASAETVSGLFREQCRLSGRLPGTASLIAVLSVSLRHSPTEVLTRCTSYKAAGFDGVVIDWQGLPDIKPVLSILASVLES